MKPLTLISLLALVAIGLWFLMTSHAAAMRNAPAAEHLAMVFDNSISQKLACETLPATVLAGLSGMSIRKGSRVTIFTLGSPASSWEPVKVLDMAAPRKGGMMFGGGSFEGELQRACAGITQVSASSIYRAVEVALDHLRGEGGGKLIIESDGEENVTRGPLRRGAKGGAGKGAALNNTGIRVSWCGFAVTDGGGGPRGEQTDALLARWRDAFTDPSAVTFRPFCEGAAPAGAPIAKGASHAH